MAQLITKSDHNDEASTHVVSFEVEMCEVDRDAILSWSDDLPDTVLIRWIQLRERRALNGAVSRLNVSSTRVCEIHPTTGVSTGLNLTCTARLISKLCLSCNSDSNLFL